MVKRYDLTKSHYGVDPPSFMRDAFDHIASELEPNEEATVAINPEHFPEAPEFLASMAPEAGLAVVSSAKLAPDDVEVQVKKAA